MRTYRSPLAVAGGDSPAVVAVAEDDRVWLWQRRWREVGGAELVAPTTLDVGVWDDVAVVVAGYPTGTVVVYSGHDSRQYRWPVGGAGPSAVCVVRGSARPAAAWIDHAGDVWYVTVGVTEPELVGQISRSSVGGISAIVVDEEPVVVAHSGWEVAVFGPSQAVTRVAVPCSIRCSCISEDGRTLVVGYTPNIGSGYFEAIDVFEIDQTPTADSFSAFKSGFVDVVQDTDDIVEVRRSGGPPVQPT